MTDPDERAINRALSYLDVDMEHVSEEKLQDLREAARAALHRLFRDRRRLERLVANVDQTPEYLNLLAEVEQLREENDRLKSMDLHSSCHKREDSLSEALEDATEMLAWAYQWVDPHKHVAIDIAEFLRARNALKETK